MYSVALINIKQPYRIRILVVTCMKTMDYFWQQKYVLGRALVERGEVHEAILLELDELYNNMHHIANHLGIKLVDSTLADSNIKPNIG